MSTVPPMSVITPAVKSGKAQIGLYGRLAGAERRLTPQTQLPASTKILSSHLLNHPLPLLIPPTLLQPCKLQSLLPYPRQHRNLLPLPLLQLLDLHLLLRNRPSNIRQRQNRLARPLEFVLEVIRCLGEVFGRE